MKEESQLNIGIDLQAENGVNVSKSDSVVYRATPIFVGTAGNVTVVNQDGTTCIFKNIANGTFLPVLVTGIKSTGTTASDFVVFNQ